MLRTWWVGVPLEPASGLQLANAGLYWSFFRRVRPPEESATAPGAEAAAEADGAQEA